MAGKLRFEVSPAQQGQELKQILRQMGVSSTRIKAAKRHAGGILLNGEPVFTNVRPRAGDVAELWLGEERDSAVTPVEGELAIVYEDEAMLILNKPPLMPVHPSPGHAADSLANLVEGLYQRRGESRLFRPVNRLDRHTSGLMAVAKDAHSHFRLVKQMQEGSFQRLYLALVQGSMPQESGVIDLPIGRKDGSAIARCVREDGAPAVTEYAQLCRGTEASLVAFRLRTGRTHQIRVHAAHIGHPLVGDFLYGTETPPRCLLHACALRCLSPESGAPLSFFSGLPEDMEKAAQALGIAVTIDEAPWELFTKEETKKAPNSL